MYNDHGDTFDNGLKTSKTTVSWRPPPDIHFHWAIIYHGNSYIRGGRTEDKCMKCMKSRSPLTHLIWTRLSEWQPYSSHQSYPPSPIEGDIRVTQSRSRWKWRVSWSEVEGEGDLVWQTKDSGSDGHTYVHVWYLVYPIGSRKETGDVFYILYSTILLE